MTPELWRQVRSVLAEALELSPQERPAFLDRACSSDHVLRREVDLLLSSGDVARSSFLESSPLRLTLSPGTKLGNYEIKGLLGSGGMGEVYRARDTKLARDVAIKVLPPFFSRDPDRLRRFEQEAQAAAALNHQNILAVFQMGTYEGAPYLVSEFLEGGTLREQLSRGPMPLRKAIDCGVQIARGLAAAHEKGIVHRDLKPENLFVTKDGRVKILDFGLAKLLSGRTTFDQTITTATKGTEPGVVMGTVGYMSPEQVRGEPADHRADIFSFGAILYEMISGKRAFQKPTSAETMSAILNQEPPSISQIAPAISPAMQRVLNRCLQKNAEQRFQSASDLAFAVEALSDSGSSLAAVAQERHRRISARATAILSILILSIVAATTWWLTRGPTTARPPTLTLTRLTSDSGLTAEPALSPDGKLLAYASDRAGQGNLDIYVKQVGGGEPLRLTRGPGDNHEPSFSPDGTAIAFRSEQEGGGIYVVSAFGGSARKLVAGGSQPRFSPNGDWIAYSLQSGSCFGTRDVCKIYVVPSGGGEPRQLRPDFAAAFYAVWSPDGTHLLFLGKPDQRLPQEEGFDWWVTPLDSGPVIKTGALEATRNANLAGPVQVYRWWLLAPAWQPDGNALIFSARSGDSTSLWRIAISTKTWKVVGAVQRLTSGTADEETPSVASGAGGIVRLAFASLTDNLDIWSLPIQSNQGKVTGEAKRLTLYTGPDFHPALSPDGNKMVWVSARSGNQEVWIRDLRSGEDSALTASRSDKWHPRFSPDGSKVSFSSYEDRKWNVYVIPASGGTAQRVCEDCGEANGWSSDGKRIIGNRLEARAWVLELGTMSKTNVLPVTRPVYVGPISSDNRWFVFGDTATRRTYIAPFDEPPVGESAWIPVVNDWWNWEWSPDDGLIYSLSERDGFECIWAQRLDAATKRPLGDPFAVFHAHNARVSLANQGVVYLSAGHDKMLFNMDERTGNIWMAEWNEH